MDQFVNLDKPEFLTAEMIKKMEKFKEDVYDLYTKTFGEPQSKHPDVMFMGILGTEKGSGVLSIGCEVCLAHVAGKYFQLMMMNGKLNHPVTSTLGEGEDVKKEELDEIQMPDDSTKH